MSVVLSVTQLNSYIKSIIDGDMNLNSVFIEGEISNFKNHYSSGHLYFSLKDKTSIIKCVMFSSAASRLKFKPEDSMSVICRGRISVYERDGQYQLYIDDMQPTGIGALALAYEKLKEKLQKEGLFDPTTKRPLPDKINRIAVITSNTGAAIHDILSILNRRNPNVEIVFCPVLVQGENAAESMVNMLEKVYSADDIDLIIIGRGGGSYEDLYCFNDEELVRKIYESPIPVISAVGHESDFTLCDFVADIRAATPSAAAEIATKDMSDVKFYIDSIKSIIINLCKDKIYSSFERYDKCIESQAFSNPKLVLSAKTDRFKTALLNFRLSSDIYYKNASNKFMVNLSKLEALNPLSIMSRGYSIAYKNDKVLTSTDDIETKDEITLKFYKGKAKCLVDSIETED